MAKTRRQEVKFCASTKVVYTFTFFCDNNLTVMNTKDAKNRFQAQSMIECLLTQFPRRRLEMGQGTGRRSHTGDLMGRRSPGREQARSQRLR